VALVRIPGYMDVFLLHPLCTGTMEKARQKLVVPISARWRNTYMHDDSINIILKYFSDFSQLQLQQLKALEGLYKDWNNKINVISRKDIDSLYEKHVLHSLSIAAIFDFEPGTEIIDIGTGGGFPGIPLAIFFPEVQFHLVDSIAKKIKVAEAVAESIGLKNVTAQNIRAEEIKKRKFDFAVSRAVASLKDLWRWSKSLLKKERKYEKNPINQENSPFTIHQPGLICLKGGDLAKEIQEGATRPAVIELASIFSEDFFKEKFLLYVR
jgi:16S rRNA (guanine527-N7)-methyltransferase